jgi:hypothetical protein
MVQKYTGRLDKKNEKIYHYMDNIDLSNRFLLLLVLKNER